MGWDRNPRSVLRDIYEDDFGAAFRDVALTGLRSVVFNTPVDTGRLRGGWLVNVSAPSNANLNEPDKSGGATIAKGQSVIARANIGDTLIIENNVEYGIYINDGTPKIRPHRMVERAADELEKFFG